MAYYNGFPVTYQPGYYNPYYQQMAQQQMAQQQMMQHNQGQQPQQQQIQQSSFVLVRSEDEARNYPVAPGNSITFKDESRDYCYVKSMGFNQLDRPIFERYRMVKEEDAPTAPNSPAQPSQSTPNNSAQYATKADIEAVMGEIEAIKAEINKKAKLTEEVTDHE